MTSSDNQAVLSKGKINLKTEKGQAVLADGMGGFLWVKRQVNW